MRVWIQREGRLGGGLPGPAASWASREERGARSLQGVSREAVLDFPLSSHHDSQRSGVGALWEITAARALQLRRWARGESLELGPKKLGSHAGSAHTDRLCNLGQTTWLL